MTEVPFSREHLAAFPAFVRVLGDLGASPAAITGPAWTALADGAPVACYGVRPGMPGQGEAWFLLAPAAPWRSVMKLALRRALAEWQTGRWRRVSATAQADCPAARRFAEWVGFQPEGILHAWGPAGEDHIMYGLWRR